MSASDQLVRIGQGRKLHLLASHLMFQPVGDGIKSRAACGAKGKSTPRWLLPLDTLEELEACAQCTKVARSCASMLEDHELIFHGEVGRG